MHGNELNVAYFQRHGFNTPLLFKEKTGLGLRVPTSNFTINDVRMCVGSRRVLDVMDVNTQKNSEMSMKEWQRYYEDPDKDKLLNVISLEFSHTRLENYVQSPTVVSYAKIHRLGGLCLAEAFEGKSNGSDERFGGDEIPKSSKILPYVRQRVLHGFSRKQSDIFFGDTVEKCARIVLHEGNTFFIPTGWIHAVYTPVDSLVFGGNFLHSYGIDKQLKIAQVEDTTKEIVMYLHLLPPNKKNVPDLLKDPVSLIQDVRTLIGLHRQDSRELAITGRPVLTVPEDQENRTKIISPRGPYNKGNNLGKAPKQGLFKGPKTSPQGPVFCLDMVKFGGPGRAKQTCNMRQCLQPMLPVTAACAHCGLDGWMQTPVTPLQKGPQRCESASNLMECSVCYEIAHPICVQRLCPEFTGYINEDMPNSWECPMCCKLGKNTDYRPRHFRARQKSSDMRRMSISSDASSAFENKHHQEQMSDSGSENEHKDKELLPIKKRRSSECAEVETKTVPVSDLPRKTAFRMQLAHQIASNSTKVLKKPMVVVRPAPLMMLNALPTNNLALDKRCILHVFKYLSPKDLLVCALVCKTWATYSIDPSLWKKMVFNRKHISSDILKGIVRRQPECLNLDWCHINKFQLPWLIQRLNQLKELSLVSVNVKTSISLRTNHSAVLQLLDLSFISDFNDSALREILGPNNDSRSGLAAEKIRFRNLKTLRLAGTDVTDIAMRYVTQHLPSLQHLSLSLCPRISDAGIAQLSTKPANTVTNLMSLDLSHSKLVTENSLEHLSKCEKLTKLDCRHSLQISTQALIKFAAKSEHNLQVRDIKLVDVRQKVQ
ncbi:hypothetical protein NQ314_002046 [Rhamnusium bicolor]|uniref:JmjC domain-containing histone demethylation protein 1 n=1 Tax=Rhamnusium bicolor TaxID=1586634 RepID=A0AAV8ZSJ6_9CUCU|nr:hypothetical protein NQ314_002046 [Rhamnusium bicolor]